jgi:DNA-binding response OmpR family regulator
MIEPEPAAPPSSIVASGPQLLLVEDEDSIALLVKAYLSQSGYRVMWVRSGEEALESLDRVRPRLVILDIGLPGQDGFDVCRAIRARSPLPILMLTARDEEADRVAGLELGADDYVTKPFSPRELAARVRTVLRRAAPGVPTSERLTFEELEIDAQTREVRRRGSLLELTAREFDLLWFLASHPRQVFSRDLLMERVWGYAAALDTGTVTVHIRRLREKVEDDPSHPRFLQTVWGVGYRFAP